MLPGIQRELYVLGCGSRLFQKSKPAHNARILEDAAIDGFGTLVGYLKRSAWLLSLLQVTCFVNLLMFDARACLLRSPPCCFRELHHAE